MIHWKVKTKTCYQKLITKRKNNIRRKINIRNYYNKTYKQYNYKKNRTRNFKVKKTKYKIQKSNFKKKIKKTYL